LKGSFTATLQPVHGSVETARAGSRSFKALARVLSADQLFAFADQAVVGATSFVALLMIGRWSNARELGAYAVACSVVALFLAAQEALVTRPYAIQLHRPPGRHEEHAFGSLLLSGLLSAVAVLVLMGTASALFFANVTRELTEIVFTLAGAIGFISLREFARRFAFAHLKFKQALALDAAVALIQLLLLGLLVGTERLSAATSVAALGISCGIAGVAWLFLADVQFSVRLAALRATLTQTWELGKWLLCGQMAVQAQGYMSYWLSMVIAGAATTGIYAACMSLVALANPLLFGFFNVLMPRSVRTFHNHGAGGLRQEAARNSLVLLALLSPLCLLVICFGENALHILFPGKEYSGNGHVLSVLALSSLAAAIGVPASIALSAVERARAVAAVMIATSVLNVLLVWWLMRDWGLLGAAYGVLIAEMFGSFARWAAFLTLVPKTERRRDACE